MSCHRSPHRQASPTSLLARWFDSGRKVRPMRRFRPSIHQESLEDRVVLSTITVNTLLDGALVPSGSTSLRAAINAANQSTSNVTINFAPSLTSQSDFGVRGAFLPLTPLPDLNNVRGQQITLNGLTNSDGGPATVIESWSTNFSGYKPGYNTGTNLVVDNGGRVTLDNVFVTNSSSRGLVNNGILSLNNCNVWNNQNSGIANAGILTASSSNFDSNYASVSGGAITNHTGGTLVLHDDVFNGNTSNKGGAIENYYGTVAVDQGSTFLNNTAFNTSTTLGAGGAISNEYGTMTISSAR